MRQRLFLIPVLFSLSVKASGIADGFMALAEYDYFRARRCFYQVLKKSPSAAACYGLAVIYSRQDNPFTNNDSAVKYANRSWTFLMQKYKPVNLAGFNVDSVTVRQMARMLGSRHLRLASARATAEAYEEFLRNNLLSGEDLLQQAATLRDEAEFARVISANRSDTTAFFIVTHPQSVLMNEARLLQDRQLYEEHTPKGSIEELRAFIRRFPSSSMINTAYQALYLQLKQRSDVKGLAAFVRSYPKAPQLLEAWKLLFTLTVKSYTFAEFRKFIAEFPDFPLKSPVLKELELNKITMYPYQRNDLTGFIDSKGKLLIQPLYDAGGSFHEGLSAVTRNDTAFYINKENVNPFERTFQDAYAFRNGIAAVKSEGKWYFINRLGQVISGTYDEMSDLSGQVYVYRKDSLYGALDQFGQQLIPPRFARLGDFRNGFAYYSENGRYGFVSIIGKIHQAVFDWISDFSEDGIAVFKSGTGYGLVNGAGRTLLEPAYESLQRVAPGQYMVVLTGNYGFFDANNGCFTLLPVYEYQKDKPAEFYGDGRTFRVFRRGDAAIVNRNGLTIIPPGLYEDTGLESCGLFRAKKKKRYGYVDSKLTTVVPFKYLDATDYADSVAMVKFKDGYILLGAGGKELYESTLPIEKLANGYYMTDDGDSRTIFNRKGETLTGDVVNIQHTEEGVFIFTLSTGEIKLLKE